MGRIGARGFSFLRWRRLLRLSALRTSRGGASLRGCCATVSGRFHRSRALEPRVQAAAKQFAFLSRRVDPKWGWSHRGPFGLLDSGATPRHRVSPMGWNFSLAAEAVLLPDESSKVCLRSHFRPVRAVLRAPAWADDLPVGHHRSLSETWHCHAVGRHGLEHPLRIHDHGGVTVAFVQGKFVHHQTAHIVRNKLPVQPLQATVIDVFDRMPVRPCQLGHMSDRQ